MTRRRPHVALWGAWYGSRNVGDRALLATIPPILEEALGEPVRVTVLTDDATWVREYGPRESGCDVRAVQNRRQVGRLVATLARCDLFVVGGGVPVYPQPYHLAVTAFLVGVARLAGTPYMTWSVGAQPLDRVAARTLFRWVLDGAAAVTCRDPRSEEILRSTGSRRPIRRGADPAFRLATSRDDEREAAAVLERAGAAPGDGRPLGALVCRRTRADHPYGAEHYEPKSPERIANTLDCFAAALDRLWERGLRPVFVPMNTVSPDDDRESARAVAARARHGAEARFVDEPLRPALVPALLRGFQVGLTSRLHAMVLAAVAGVPMAVHAIGPKLRGMAEVLALDPWALDDATATPEATAARIDDLLDRRDAVAARLRDRVEAQRAQALVPGVLAAEILTRRRRATR